MDRLIWFTLFMVSIALISGCASKPPTIAHTHIGHAMTAWHDTPGQDGLMVVADKKAREAKMHAENATAARTDIDRMKTEIAKVLDATDQPTTGKASVKGETVPYGLKQALVGAIDHVTFAAESKDATDNVKKFASMFSANAVGVLERCDLISALGDELLVSSSREDAGILAQEILNQSTANLSGIDINDDGVIGSSPEEYGIQQLGNDLQIMIDNENPPYTTVDRWYLFNLIRLPSGEWSFDQSYDWGDSGGGGGGY